MKKKKEENKQQTKELILRGKKSFRKNLVLKKYSKPAISLSDSCS
jgi:hypothetical protein